MSDKAEQEGEAAPLRFDRAEYQNEEASSENSRAACTLCQQAIEGEYYDVNGQIVCHRCQPALTESLEATPGFEGFVRSIMFGGVACIVSAAIFWGFTVITNLELGLIALVVGFLVGKGVAWGSGRGGGIPFQLLAVALTYVSLAMANMGFEIYGSHVNQEIEPVGLFDVPFLFIAWLIMLPVVVFQSSPISAVIHAIALWQAWRENSPLQIDVRGPFRTGDAPPPPSE